MNFRPDINGLRALAVIAVLAFHFGVPGASGGFVGVDIFFVISGFLMTGIIVRRLQSDSFSVFAFYADRGRRIIPALALLAAVMLGVGVIWLLPQDLLSLGKQAATAVTFLSNFLFWSEYGYFAPQAQTRWLLHTWSLSVEWQFYLLYPIMVLAVQRLFGERALLAAIAALTAFSFALSLWLTATQPSAAFFLLPPRAWEMLAGGLVFLLPRVPVRFARAAQSTGLALVAIAVLTARSEGWPGPGALIPVVGTAIIIAAGREQSRITGNAVATWVGLRSYSIYLWHWPLAVALARYDREGDWVAVAAAIVVALGAGHLSYQLVERRGWRSALPWNAARVPATGLRSAMALSIPVVATALGGVGVWAARGLPLRFSPEVRAIEADTTPGGPYGRSCFSTVRDLPAPCNVGRTGATISTRAAVTLLGDSHSESAASGLVAALPSGAKGGVAFNGYASCLPLLGAKSTDPENQCEAFNRRFLEPQTRPRGVPLVLIGYWDAALESGTIRFDGEAGAMDVASLRRHLVDTSCALAKGGPTWLMLPTPTFPFRVATELQSRLVRDPDAPDISIPVSEHLARSHQVRAIMAEAARRCGVGLLDPTPALCPDGRCMGSYRHRAVFRDAHHLTEYGNRFLAPVFARVFKAAPQVQP